MADIVTCFGWQCLQVRSISCEGCLQAPLSPSWVASRAAAYCQPMAQPPQPMICETQLQPQPQRSSPQQCLQQNGAKRKLSGDSAAAAGLGAAPKQPAVWKAQLDSAGIPSAPASTPCHCTTRGCSLRAVTRTSTHAARLASVHTTRARRSPSTACDRQLGHIWPMWCEQAAPLLGARASATPASATPAAGGAAWRRSAGRATRRSAAQRRSWRRSSAKSASLGFLYTPLPASADARE
jgi:hypothetical protein